MCVIVVCEKRYPTDKELEMFEDENPDGAGVAWREAGRVRFVKGLDAEALGRMRPFLEARLPVVLHFRIATVGGKLPQLCHPFPLDGPEPREVMGGVADRVLFHNGTWTDWYDYFADSLDQDPWKWKHVVRGDWSDSRFMAGLLADQPEFIEQPGTGLEHQRLVLMDKDEVACYGTWHDYEGLRVSNLSFQRWAYTPSTPAARPLSAWAGWSDWPGQDEEAFYKAVEEAAILEDEAAREFDALGLDPGPMHGEVVFDESGQWMYDADLDTWLSLGDMKVPTP